MEERQKEGDYELSERGNLLEVTLMYPSCEGKVVKGVEIDLRCVRAASSIIVRFCHERDAWVISRKIAHGYNSDGEQVEEEATLALIPSWTCAPEEAMERRITTSGRRA